MRSVDALGRRWIPGLVGALVVVAGIGFWPGYFSRFPRFANSGWQVHFHLVTIVAWLGALVVQGALAARGRLDLHRRVGRWSYALVPVIVLGFVLVADFGQRRHREPALIGATVLDGALFVTFYVLAMVRRRSAILHGRYMLLTAVAFIDPALGRAADPRVALPFELVVIVAIVALTRDRAWRARGTYGEPRERHGDVLAGLGALKHRTLTFRVAPKRAVT